MWVETLISDSTGNSAPMVRRQLGQEREEDRAELIMTKGEGSGDDRDHDERA